MRRQRVRGLLILACVVGLVAMGVYGWLQHKYGAPGALQETVSVTIPKGATLTEVAHRLAAVGAVPSAREFLLVVRLARAEAHVQAGEYDIAPGESMRTILARLVAGDVRSYRLTIPEGMPSVQVRARVLAEPHLSGPLGPIAEGSVLPDTYDFQRGETRAAFVARLQAQMERTLAELWAKRAPGLPLANAHQAVTLASIVEKETQKKAELPQVAGVFINRLRRSMRLQADPTIIYPITLGQPLGRRILRSEIMAVNGYNTYTRDGLPVGPIANPSRAAIAAVLNPARTDKLFFVADGSGGHVFAATLADHEANVRRWRAHRARTGE